LRVPKEATVVELEIYAMGEPTGAKIKIDPAFVAGVEGLPGKPRAIKVEIVRPAHGDKVDD
jgi:hypothetical protein